MTRFRRHRLRNPWRLVKKEQSGLERMMSEIWYLRATPSQAKLGASYHQHIKSLLRVKQQVLNLRLAEDVLDLVTFLRSSEQKSLAVISSELRAQKPSWFLNVPSEQDALAAIEFGMQLWLFAPPDASSTSATLADSMKQSVGGVTEESRLSTIEALAPDFSERTLTKKGGISILWTSNILEHLTFESETHLGLRVFRHWSALSSLEQSLPPVHDFYPEHFLSETQMTLRLLFQPNDIGMSGRIQKLAKKGPADLEAGTGSNAPLDLASYPIWRNRLARIQERYDKTKPGTLRQWWHDTRNKPTRATFWIAVVIFFLTVMFGVISSVTSIIQVIKT